MFHPLEGLALTTLPENVLIKKLAAMWCSHYGNSAPTSGGDILSWVKEDFGNVTPKSRDRAVRLALGAEVKRQLAIRRMRKKNRRPPDVMELDPQDPTRQRALLDKLLGPPRKWVSPLRTGICPYNQYTINSGLVAAIIPTTIKLRSIRNPSLLVYRQAGDRARSYWVPGSLANIADVLVWLIPDKLLPALKAGEIRVEHYGKRQKVRAIAKDGSTRLYRWRKIVGQNS